MSPEEHSLSPEDSEFLKSIDDTLRIVEQGLSAMTVKDFFDLKDADLLEPVIIDDDASFEELTGLSPKEAEAQWTRDDTFFTLSAEEAARGPLLPEDHDERE